MNGVSVGNGTEAEQDFVEYCPKPITEIDKIFFLNHKFRLASHNYACFSFFSLLFSQVEDLS